MIPMIVLVDDSRDLACTNFLMMCSLWQWRMVKFHEISGLMFEILLNTVLSWICSESITGYSLLFYIW